MSKVFRFGVLFATYIFGFPRLFFFAYIDPNTGGMLFQLLAVLFGVFSSLILVFSGKIKAVFYRLRRNIRSSESEQVDESEVA